MKYYELDAEEEEILRAVEAGEYVEVPNLEQVKADLVAAVRNTLAKTKNINIRISESVLMSLKAKAIEEGVPYQTLAASILLKATRR
jgi:predicted DNA binding CopG/RHH family protein